MRQFLVIYENYDGELCTEEIWLSSDEKTNQKTFQRIINSCSVFNNNALKIYGWSLIED